MGFAPLYKDHYYYVRIATGLIATAYVFLISAIVAYQDYKNYDGFVRTEGRTSYFSSLDVLAGSNGQVMFSLVVAAVAFLVAVVAIVFGFRDSLLEKAKYFFGTAGFLLFAVGFLGWFGVAGINFLLLGDLIGNRQLFWIFLVLFLVGGVVGTLIYAREESGTLLDKLDEM